MGQTTSDKISAADRAQLRTLIEAAGVAGAARQLGVSRGVVLAAAGNSPIRRGSVALLQVALEAQRAKAVSK